MRYKSIFLSDIHLGSDYINHDIFLKEFKEMEADNLFLVGDVFNVNSDKNHKSIEEFREILDSKDWDIIYINGNHEDDRERLYKNRLLLSLKRDITKQSSYIYHSKEMIYLEHGHSFHKKDILNRALKEATLLYKRVKKVKTKISLSNSSKRKKDSFYFKYIKPFAQKLLSSSFEKYMVSRAKKSDCSVVICGHLHLPKDSVIEDIRYLNCGDWIKSNSYIVEDNRGNLTIHTPSTPLISSKEVTC